MPIPVGFAQVNFFFTGSAVPTGAQCTLGLDLAGYSGTASQCAEDVGAALGVGGLDNETADNCNLTNILVKFGPDSTGPSGSFAFTGDGDQGIQGGPAQAFLVQKNTAFGGRAGRGRLYWPGVPEAGINEAGTIAAGAIAALQTAFTNFKTELEATNLNPVLLHGEGSPITIPTPILSFTVSSTAATQRRRLRR